MPLLLAFATLAALVLAALALLRWHDARADRQEWQRLAALQPSSPARFHHAMVAGLPEPARRFFQFSIEEGARLWTVAEIDMGGQFSLGSKEQPRFQPMQARQILAAPHGFVWQLQLPGAMPIAGSDAGHWTRFRLLGLVPVARQGGDEDHTRSAFGRYEQPRASRYAVCHLLHPLRSLRFRRSPVARFPPSRCCVFHRLRHRGE